MKFLFPLIFSLATLIPTQANAALIASEQAARQDSRINYETKKIGDNKPAPPEQNTDIILSMRAAEILELMKEDFPHIQGWKLKCYAADSETLKPADLVKAWENTRLMGLASFEVSSLIDAYRSPKGQIIIKSIDSELRDAVITLSVEQSNKIVPQQLIQDKELADEMRVDGLSTFAHEISHLEFRLLYPLIQPEFFTGTRDEYFILVEGYAFYHQKKYISEAANPKIAERIFDRHFKKTVNRYLNGFAKDYMKDGKIDHKAIEKIHEDCARKLLRTQFLDQIHPEVREVPYSQEPPPAI